MYQAQWHLGCKDEKTGPFPSRNSYSVEGQVTKQMIMIQCGKNVKRRRFKVQAKEQYLWEVLPTQGLVDINCSLNVSEGLKEWHPNELTDEKQSCHLSLASLVRYPIPELRFLVCNLRSHALRVWFFGKSW